MLVRWYGFERQRGIDSVWPHVNLRAAVKDPACSTLSERSGGLLVGNTDIDVETFLLSSKETLQTRGKGVI